MKPKTLHHPEHFLTKQLELRNKLKKFDAQKACLLKYFPKYYKNLVTSLSSKDWPVISKLRQAKVIESLALEDIKDILRKDEARIFKKLEQKIFRNKRKSVKSLPIAQSTGPYSTRKYRPQINTFFPRITSLDLTLISDIFEERWGRVKRMKPMFIGRELEQKTWRSYGYFWKGFRDLRHLKMSRQNRFIWLILKEINSSSRFLSSLKTLKLSLKFRDHPNETVRIRNFLFELEKNGHFLSHLSHLDCEEFVLFHCYDALMGSILSQCPKLVSLSFPIGREAGFYETPEDIYRECKEIRVLEQVKTMESLRTLSISAYGIKTLAKHFSVPPSVQKLSLTIGHSFYEQDLLDLFQEPEYNFFDRWKGFHNLGTLNLRMRAIEEVNDLVTKFAKPLFEAIPNLKKFSFGLIESPICPVDDCPPLDFSALLENETVVKQLESLKIVLADGGQIAFDPEKSHLLSSLRKLVLKGDLSDEFDSKSFLQSFLSTPDNANAKTKKTLKIPSLSFESVEAFSEFIKLALRRIRSGNLVLDIEMRIDLTIRSCKELFNHFKIPLVLEENESFGLDVFLRSSSEAKEISDFRKKEFRRIFGCLNAILYQQDGRSKRQLI